MKIKAKGMSRFVFAVLLCLLAALFCLTLSSCSGSGATDEPDEGGDEHTPYVNVYLPDIDLLVTVAYDAERGQLMELGNTLFSEAERLGHSLDELEFSGLYDMAEGGNIIFNSAGYLHGDYGFSDGMTLFARFKEVSDGNFISLNLYYDRLMEKSYRSTSISKANKNPNLGGAPSYIDKNCFAGWAEVSTGKLVTNRDGYVIDGYDIFSGSESNFFALYYSSKVVRAKLHLADGTVPFECSSSSNATERLPIDDDGKRVIVGWSTDPKAKYFSDVDYPTYLGSDSCKIYLLEGADYYAVYSEYKDVKLVFGDYAETERIYKDCDEYNTLYLSERISGYKEDMSYFSLQVVAYRAKDGELFAAGRNVSYSDASSEYSIIKMAGNYVKFKVVLHDPRTADETSCTYSLYDSKIFISPPKDADNFLGWYSDSESLDAGELEYFRIDCNKRAYVKYANEEKERTIYISSYSDTIIHLYAVFSEEIGGDEQ